jgi:hypothetical protein
MNWDKIAELVVDTFLYVSSFVIVGIALFTLFVYTARCIDLYF